MLGVSKTRQSFQFNLFSKNATEVLLRLFHKNAATPFMEAPLKRTESIWEVQLENLPDFFEYTYRCDGPYNPKQGHLFNKTLDLIDPYAKHLSETPKWNEHQGMIRGVVCPPTPFDWEHVSRPMIPSENLVIYEMHVRGFTNHLSSQVKHPGTFLGMIEKIPHLKSLGVNAVELLPIHTFNERENLRINPKTGQPLLNYWGYSTANFFTPMRRYGTPEDLKALVKALHHEGIEILLDVVYNHTSEGSSFDYYHSFRGIDNATYYMNDEKGYFNYSGCGNTFNCNHPIVQDLILDSLRYFVTEYHIDGFRFDLASILTRDQDGTPLDNPPLTNRITKDPILGSTKLIAEPWDPGGLYQVGSFPSWRFGEWNDQFRDDIRHFIRGDGNKAAVIKRLRGSPDLYPTPNKSYNYITIHDGFSLNDLVSYNHKHNEANGEQSRDGMENNVSWNCGEEGSSEDPNVLTLRERQIRNSFVVLLMAQGIPMILMGDEYSHTKLGNNNTWCQDNELNYFLWDKMKQNQNLFQFVSKLLKIRKNTLEYTKTEWNDQDNSLFLSGLINDSLLIAFNPSPDTITWKLPHSKWTRLIDTTLIIQEEIFIENTYTLLPYSSIILTLFID